jgi:hypothetical protein
MAYSTSNTGIWHERWRRENRALLGGGSRGSEVQLEEGEVARHPNGFLKIMDRTKGAAAPAAAPKLGAPSGIEGMLRDGRDAPVTGVWESESDPLITRHLQVLHQQLQPSGPSKISNTTSVTTDDGALFQVAENKAQSEVDDRIEQVLSGRALGLANAVLQNLHCPR